MYDEYIHEDVDVCVQPCKRPEMTSGVYTCVAQSRHCAKTKNNESMVLPQAILSTRGCMCLHKTADLRSIGTRGVQDSTICHVRVVTAAVMRASCGPRCHSLLILLQCHTRKPQTRASKAHLGTRKPCTTLHLLLHLYHSAGVQGLGYLVGDTRSIYDCARAQCSLPGPVLSMCCLWLLQAATSCS